ncbi:MAG: hypothetical protein MHPSP_003390 [Paramarteilia canceri]
MIDPNADQMMNMNSNSSQENNFESQTDLNQPKKKELFNNEENEWSSGEEDETGEDIKRVLKNFEGQLKRSMHQKKQKAAKFVEKYTSKCSKFDDIAQD